MDDILIQGIFHPRRTHLTGRRSVSNSASVCGYCLIEAYKLELNLFGVCFSDPNDGNISRLKFDAISLLLFQNLHY